MDNMETCDFCGEDFDYYKKTVVNMNNDANRFLNRKFFICEKCACGILEKAVNNDPMNKRCNKGVNDEQENP